MDIGDLLQVHAVMHAVCSLCECGQTLSLLVSYLECVLPSELIS